MATPIKTIHSEVVELAQTLGHTVNPDHLLTIIRQTRAKSDISVFFPDFNPQLLVTGTDARKTLSFYLQLTNGAVTYNPQLSADIILPAPPAEVKVAKSKKSA